MFPNASVATPVNVGPPAPRTWREEGVTEIRAGRPALTVTSRVAWVVPRRGCQGRDTGTCVAVGERQMVPGETESDSVLVHGPARARRNVPADELERSVTAAGRTTAEASDELKRRRRHACDETNRGRRSDRERRLRPRAEGPPRPVVPRLGDVDRAECLAGAARARLRILGVDAVARVTDGSREPVEDLPRLRGEVPVREARRFRGSQAKPQWSCGWASCAEGAERVHLRGDERRHLVDRHHRPAVGRLALPRAVRERAVRALRYARAGSIVGGPARATTSAC